MYDCPLRSPREKRMTGSASPMTLQFDVALGIQGGVKKWSLSAVYASVSGRSLRLPLASVGSNKKPWAMIRLESKKLEVAS